MAKATGLDKKRQWVVVLGFQNNDYLTIPCEDQDQALNHYGTISNLLTSDTAPYRSRSDDWVEVAGARGFRATFNHIDAVWVRVEEQPSWDDIF